MSEDDVVAEVMLGPGGAQAAARAGRGRRRGGLAVLAGGAVGHRHVAGDGRRLERALTPSRCPTSSRPGLDVLFCGINPSLLSAERGHHFARPGNRFWPALHLAGLTPRRLTPDEDRELLAVRPGRDQRGGPPDPDGGGADPRGAAGRRGRSWPRWSPATGRGCSPSSASPPGGRRSTGRGRCWAGSRSGSAGRSTWVAPNPSGLNAHHQLPDLARLYGVLREAARTGG